MSRQGAQRSIVLFAAMAIGLVMASPAAAQLDMAALAKRAKLTRQGEQHRVMAFYYPWYGLPGEPGSEHKRHWGEIDRKQQQISNTAHYPELGPYDSYDREVIDRHMQWAKQNHIDTFIVSWWGNGRKNGSDGVMPRLLEAAKQHDRKITIYYETVPDPQNAESAAKDIKQVLDKYADHPAFLKVNGRPVIFIYGRALREIGTGQWLAVQQRLAEMSDKRPLLIGDSFGRVGALVFDGVHAYNTAGKLRNKSLAEAKDWINSTYEQWVALAEHTDRISTLTVIPGFDKTQNGGFKTKRFGGRLYDAQWRGAIEANPDWVLITSFNEWHEGSDIEPSVEYGEKYLKMTGRFAKRFKNQVMRTDAPEQQASISGAKLEQLKQKLSETEMAFLPNASSTAVTWMMTRLNASPQAISWERLVSAPPDPDQTPVLIYAAGERYQQTVNEPGDVDKALQQYLRDGGFLVVLPAKAAPFHYNMAGKTLANADKFGMPGITLYSDSGVRSWETPPEGADLTFVQPNKRLAHLPKQFPYPETGDVRWRPLNARGLKSADKHLPLLVLRNGKGEYLGDAISYIELRHTRSSGQSEGGADASGAGGTSGGGRVLYCWFNLLQGEHRSAVLYDVFNFVAEQTPAQ